jgi:hypothetical protein
MKRHAADGYSRDETSAPMVADLEDAPRRLAVEGLYDWYDGWDVFPDKPVQRATWMNRADKRAGR